MDCNIDRLVYGRKHIKSKSMNVPACALSACPAAVADVPVGCCPGKGTLTALVAFVGTPFRLPNESFSAWKGKGLGLGARLPPGC